MDSYKHIETCIGNYIAAHYAGVIEIGVGNNPGAAIIIHDAGIPIRCTDIKRRELPDGMDFVVDDVFEPDLSIYTGADVLYAIRPALEMMAPLIALAKHVNCDLLVYHLGFEFYETGGEKIDCGVILHRYVKGSEPVKER